MNFLEEARRRIGLAAQANEEAPAPDDAELKFRDGMALVLQNIDKVDEKLLQEMMTVLMDQLQRRFGKQPAEQQPATNKQIGPKTPDINSYFAEPGNKPGSKTPDISSYFD